MSHVVRSARMAVLGSDKRYTNYSVSYWDPNAGVPGHSTVGNWVDIRTYNGQEDDETARRCAYALCCYLNGGERPLSDNATTILTDLGQDHSRCDNELQSARAITDHILRETELNPSTRDKLCDVLAHLLEAESAAACMKDTLYNP